MCLLSVGISDISKNYMILGIIYVSMSLCYSKSALGLKKEKDRISKRYLYSHIRYSIIHNSEEVETI